MSVKGGFTVFELLTQTNTCSTVYLNKGSVKRVDATLYYALNFIKSVFFSLINKIWKFKGLFESKTNKNDLVTSLHILCSKLETHAASN